MSIVLLSRDLMLVSRTQGAANSLQMTLECASDAERAIDLATSPACRAVVIDLRTPNLDVAELVAKIRDLDHDVPVIACSPHVHEASLTAARNAGCDVVATRGQFDRDAESILREVLR